MYAHVVVVRVHVWRTVCSVCATVRYVQLFRRNFVGVFGSKGCAQSDEVKLGEKMRKFEN